MVTMDGTLFLVCCIWMVISPRLVYSDVYNLVLGKQINHYEPEKQVSFQNQKNECKQCQENKPLLENLNHLIMIKALNECNDNEDHIPLLFPGEPNISDNQDITPMPLLNMDDSNIQSVPNLPEIDQNYANPLMPILQSLGWKHWEQRIPNSSENNQPDLILPIDIESVPNLPENYQMYFSQLVDILQIQKFEQENQKLKVSPVDNNKIAILIKKILLDLGWKLTPNFQEENQQEPNSLQNYQQYVSLVMNIVQILSRKQENQNILSLTEDDQMRLRLLINILQILGRKQESEPIPSSPNINILVKIVQILNAPEVKKTEPCEEGVDIPSIDFEWSFSTTPAPTSTTPPPTTTSTSTTTTTTTTPPPTTTTTTTTTPPPTTTTTTTTTPPPTTTTTTTTTPPPTTTTTTTTPPPTTTTTTTTTPPPTTTTTTTTTTTPPPTTTTTPTTTTSTTTTTPTPTTTTKTIRAYPWYIYSTHETTTLAPVYGCIVDCP